jgi:hypothetical protein
MNPSRDKGLWVAIADIKAVREGQQEPGKTMVLMKSVLFK